MRPGDVALAGVPGGRIFIFSRRGGAAPRKSHPSPSPRRRDPRLLADLLLRLGLARVVLTVTAARFLLLAAHLLQQLLLRLLRVLLALARRLRRRLGALRLRRSRACLASSSWRLRLGRARASPGRRRLSPFARAPRLVRRLRRRFRLPRRLFLSRRRRRRRPRLGRARSRRSSVFGAARAGVLHGDGGRARGAPGASEHLRRVRRTRSQRVAAPSRLQCARALVGMIGRPRPRRPPTRRGGAATRRPRGAAAYRAVSASTRATRTGDTARSLSTSASRWLRRLRSSGITGRGGDRSLGRAFTLTRSFSICAHRLGFLLLRLNALAFRARSKVADVCWPEPPRRPELVRRARAPRGGTRRCGASRLHDLLRGPPSPRASPRRAGAARWRRFFFRRFAQTPSPRVGGGIAWATRRAQLTARPSSSALPPRAATVSEFEAHVRHRRGEGEVSHVAPRGGRKRRERSSSGAGRRPRVSP